MDMERASTASRAKDNERLAERYRNERYEAERTLYYTHKWSRGSKWATAEVFAIIGGKLEHIATARYQPGASRGVRGEVIEAAEGSRMVPIDDAIKWNVHEIEPGL